MAAIIEPNDTLETVLGKINAEIDKRRTYGVRSEELPTTKKACQCWWSNAGAKWACGAEPDRKLKCKDGKELQERVKRVNDVREQCDYSLSVKLGVYEEMDRLRNETECTLVPRKVQCLDANQIAVVGLSKKALETLEPLMDPLPLYSGSFEARERGVFSLKGIEIPPGIAQLPLDSLNPETVKAIVDKALDHSEE